MYEVKRINISSQVKVFSILIALLYFIVGTVVAVSNTFVNPQEDRLSQLTSGIFSVILGSVVAFLMGAILSYIFGLLYNALARKSGGLKVSFRLTDDQDK